MDRQTQSLETMIRYWVYQEEKRQEEYFQLRHQRMRNWDIIEDICGKNIRERHIVENRFFA